jgi:hypothetical protein
MSSSFGERGGRLMVPCLRSTGVEASVEHGVWLKIVNALVCYHDAFAMHQTAIFFFFGHSQEIA